MVAADLCPDFRFAVLSWAEDASQARGDDLVVAGEQRRGGAGGFRYYVVSAAPAGFDFQLFPAAPSQVVVGVADGITVRVCPVMVCACSANWVTANP